MVGDVVRWINSMNPGPLPHLSCCEVGSLIRSNVVYISPPGNGVINSWECCHIWDSVLVSAIGTLGIQQGPLCSYCSGYVVHEPTGWYQGWLRKDLSTDAVILSTCLLKFACIEASLWEHSYGTQIPSQFLPFQTSLSTRLFLKLPYH